jgi:DNA-binding transcriptional regulator YiaG
VYHYGMAKKQTAWSRKLRSIRRERKLSRVELAEKLGIPVRTLMSWEQSHRSPSAGYARLLDMLLENLDKTP